MKIYLKLLNKLEVMLNYLVRFVMGFMVVICFLSVSARLLNASLFWSDELLRYSFIWLAFTTCPILSARKKHINVDFTSLFIPPQGMKILSNIGNCIVLVFLVTLTVYACKLVSLTGLQRSASLSIPMSYVYMCMPLGLGLSALYILRNIIVDFSNIALSQEGAQSL